MKTRSILAGALALAAGAALLLGGLAFGGVASAAPGGVNADRYMELVAQKLGISVDRLKQAQTDARNQLIDEELAAGRITKEQADRMRNAPAGGPAFGFGMGRGGRGMDVMGDLMGAAATRLGMTREALAQELRGGRTLAQVASEKGVSRDQLKAALTGAAQTAIQQAQSAGRITQAQADELRNNLNQRLDAMLDGTHAGPMGGPRDGQQRMPR